MGRGKAIISPVVILDGTGVHAESLHIPCSGLHETPGSPCGQRVLGSQPWTVASVPANPGARMKGNSTLRRLSVSCQVPFLFFTLKYSLKMLPRTVLGNVLLGALCF